MKKKNEQPQNTNRLGVEFLCRNTKGPMSTKKGKKGYNRKEKHQRAW